MRKPISIQRNKICTAVKESVADTVTKLRSNIHPDTMTCLTVRNRDLITASLAVIEVTIHIMGPPAHIIAVRTHNTAIIAFTGHTAQHQLEDMTSPRSQRRKLQLAGQTEL